MSIKMKNKGFTLIEIMVASSIFIIVMVIAVGAIFSLVNANRKSQALASVVSNLNISLESMVRDIRTGSNYVVNPTSISFTNQNGDSTTYNLTGTPPNRALHKRVIGSTPLNGDITAPEVNISSLSFTSIGIGNDNIQPRVQMQIKGTAGVGNYASPFTIQTLITQRLPED